MPFIAMNKETKKRIDITRFTHPRKEINAQDIICQLCQGTMIIRAGMVKRAHFAHTNACTSPYDAHPESAEHLAAKAYLKENLPIDYEDYKGVRLEYEVPIKDVNRVIDLLAIFPNGHKVAHEVQLASITTEQLEARTNDYARAGIDVVWWLGKSANTPTNRNWSVSTFGLALTLQL